MARLIDAPVGLLKYNGSLILKTEYSRIVRLSEDHKVTTPDCYVAESGEYFWGGAKTVEERNNLEVTPVAEIEKEFHFPDITKMIPLTLEQLREMDGEPVWVEFIGRPEGTPIEPLWMLVNCRENRLVTDVEYVDWNDEGWLAYPYPLPHIDREDWEPCEFCNGKESLYQYTNSTKLFINTFGKARTLVTECRSCPPYADCSMKNVPARSAFIINFCPHCGRPLAEEAWAELEKHIGGAV